MCFSFRNQTTGITGRTIGKYAKKLRISHTKQQWGQLKMITKYRLNAVV